MPRKYIKKTNRTDIDENAMKLAIRECLKKNLNISEAARQYGIKRTTLQSRIETLSKKRPLNEIVNNDSGNEPEEENKYSSKYTVKQVFTMNQEAELCQYIKRSSDLHYGLSYRQIRIIAFQFGKSLLSHKIPENWETHQMAGKEWLFGFMKRHSDLSLRKPENTSLSRSMAFNKPVVDDFFNKYISVLQKYQFTAENIWNLDETGVTTVMRPVKVVSTKGKKQVGQIASGERGVLVTFVGIINAIGTSLPPVFVYPRTRNPSQYLSEGSPTGSIALGNKSGWMKADIFPEVLIHIVNHTRCSTDNKILLLIDNHESHLSVKAIRYCKLNGIVLLSFPPHTTHRLQPLDVGIYAPFKANLAAAFNDWMLAHPGQAITIRNIGSLSNKAYENSFTLRNIKNAFKKTGLWPPDRLIFTESDFAASSVTDRPLVVDKQNNSSDMIEVSHALGTYPNKESVSGDISDQPSTSGLNITGQDFGNLSVCTLENSKLSEKCDLPSNIFNQPSIAGPSSGFHSLEELYPYPKADMKKKKQRRARKSKCTVYTDTPELAIRENLELEKQRKQETKKKRGVKRKVFNESANWKELKKCRKISSSSDSDVSLDKVNSASSDDLEEFENVSNDDFQVGDFVLVRFPSKKNILHYIGRVEELTLSLLTVKFMRRKGAGHIFLFPEVDEIVEVDLSDVVAKLHTPSQTGTTRTSSIFTFNYNFSNLIVR